MLALPEGVGEVVVDLADLYLLELLHEVLVLHPEQAVIFCLGETDLRLDLRSPQV